MEGYVVKVVIEYPKTITFIDDRGREKKVRFDVDWLPVIDYMIFKTKQLKLKNIELKEVL
jgi:hypothetical protein